MARLGVQTALTVMGMLCGLSATYNAPLAARSLAAEVPGSNAPEGRQRGEAANGDDASPEPVVSRKRSEKDVPEGEDGKREGQAPYPLVFFSHGLAGNRNTYSSICIQLASLGFIVVAVEHADGTASTARLAPQFKLVEDKKGKPQQARQNEWLFYAGLGDEQAQVQKTRIRAQELRTALRLVESMNNGLAVEGLWVSGTKPHPLRQGLFDTGNWLRGRVDLSRVAVTGHSYGGATAALAACEHYPEFKAAVAMDPWWGALPPDCSILASGSWPSRAPILVLGSHAWNTPNPVTQKMACNGERQEALLSAAAGHKSTGPGMTALGSTKGTHNKGMQGSSQQGGDEQNLQEDCMQGKHANGMNAAATGRTQGPCGGRGPGALLVICRDSNHHSYDDVLLFFGRLMSPLLKLFNFESELHPRKSLEQVCSCTTHFLCTHLCLTQNVTAAWRSEGQKGEAAFWHPLDSPLPIKGSHADFYKVLCPGNELHILRACTASV
ncbi:platelet-activating factor acetylhydrolase, isoform II-domain-containing protein [Dunaliella salina]|uniref:1-alkyl-2-acetylglycerophosphocholine esterase n=1 Tax=Dunaliella salina TaxID=3046 RepID=A0ABQ7G533_DUNSA|nr:platelet-activating factor acetylhydrolase, isoform II-domain-containing protein [Dunaliella salina]|eukprot:KAF5829719.1 platelet-activating factor acetylhydrolase, isoform II-domain-containing protein [Dunaliella salina]